MQVERVTRRRAIRIFAATVAGLAATGSERTLAAMEHEWSGLAMGTDARILFCGVESEVVRAAIASAVAEIERLERALSLFRGDSEIRRLNQDKVLKAPTGDFRRALGLGLAIAEMSEGLFDPTVQALWEAHVDWFVAAPDAGLPPEPVIAHALAMVDWRKIVLDADAVHLGRNQRITLNGLAQGYVTDRIADLLRGYGFRHVLVDLGEQRALGPRDDGAPWSISRENAASIQLSEGALATSEGAGCILGAGGAAHHLFDPRTGRSTQQWRRVTVYHRSAAVADALSTAFSAASIDKIEAVLGKMTGVAVWITDRNGSEHRRVAGPIVGVTM
jgi:thiamine biosynthesis lipoprotein